MPLISYEKIPDLDEEVESEARDFKIAIYLEREKRRKMRKF